MCAWRTPECALPNDDKLLARMVGVTDKRWRSLKPSVMAFWRLGDDDLFRQKKLTKVRLKVEGIVHSRIAAGKASALAKSLKNHDRHSTHVDLSLQQTANKRSTTKTKTKKKESSIGKIPPVRAPESDDISVPKQRPQAMASDGPTPAGLCENETKEQAVTKRLTIPDDVRNALPKRPGA